MFDQRLFNQTAGLGAGFGHDEDYNLYDKPLFADRTAASIYKNNKNINVDDYVNNDDQQQRVRKVLGQQGPKDSEGFDKTNNDDNDNTKSGYQRSKPVEFEKTQLETADQDANYKAGLQNQK